MSKMNEELLGIARFKFHPGKVDEFKRLSNECMKIVREKDPGTLQYEIYFNSDETEAVVIERYRDSNSLIEHLKNVGDVMAPVMSTGTLTGELLGHVSSDLQEMLSEGGPQIFNPYLQL